MKRLLRSVTKILVEFRVHFFIIIQWGTKLIYLDNFILLSYKQTNRNKQGLQAIKGAVKNVRINATIKAS